MIRATSPSKSEWRSQNPSASTGSGFEMDFDVLAADKFVDCRTNGGRESLSGESGTGQTGNTGECGISGSSLVASNSIGTSSGNRESRKGVIRAKSACVITLEVK